MSLPRQIVRYPFWLTAGIGVVVFLSIGSLFHAYRSADHNARAYQDPYRINAQPESLREAVRYLPEKAQVGSLSDVSFEVATGSAAYFGVMYALAPRDRKSTRL